MHLKVVHDRGGEGVGDLLARGSLSCDCHVGTQLRVAVPEVAFRGAAMAGVEVDAGYGGLLAPFLDGTGLGGRKVD